MINNVLIDKRVYFVRKIRFKLRSADQNKYLFGIKVLDPKKVKGNNTQGRNLSNLHCIVN